MTSYQPSENCAHRLRTLSDSTRLEVIRLLLEEPRHVGEMRRQIGIEQSLLSHHLRVLRDAGLVESERDGKAVLYRVARSVASVPRSSDSIHLGCCTLSFESSASS